MTANSTGSARQTRRRGRGSENSARAAERNRAAPGGFPSRPPDERRRRSVRRRRPGLYFDSFGAARPKASVDVCICTYRRPQLAEALWSVAGQRHIDDLELRVIVVDNDDTPSARTLAETTAAEAGLTLTYLHAPGAQHLDRPQRLPGRGAGGLDRLPGRRRDRRAAVAVAARGRRALRRLGRRAGAGPGDLPARGQGLGAPGRLPFLRRDLGARGHPDRPHVQRAGPARRDRPAAFRAWPSAEPAGRTSISSTASTTAAAASASRPRPGSRTRCRRRANSSAGSRSDGSASARPTPNASCRGRAPRSDRALAVLTASAKAASTPPPRSPPCRSRCCGSRRRSGR